MQSLDRFIEHLAHLWFSEIFYFTKFGILEGSCFVVLLSSLRTQWYDRFSL